MSDCANLLPHNKWLACDKVDKILQKQKQLKHSSKFDEHGNECCVLSLWIREGELRAWGTPCDEHRYILEIFVAYLCYSLVHEFKACADGKTDRCRRRARHFRDLLGWIRENWKISDTLRGISKDILVVFLLDARLSFPLSQNDLELCSKYLDHYLKVRSIPNWVLESSVDTDHYDTLFEEYFSSYHSHNLLNTYNSSDVHKSYLISTHTKDKLNSCVGFICFKETPGSERPCSMQGIVTCPFFRKASKEQLGVLGSANTILQYLQKRRSGRSIIVSPISRNPEWYKRLSEFPFFVDSFENPLVFDKHALLQLRKKAKKRERKRKALVLHSNPKFE
jgi:hypothetical protein